MPPQQPYQPPQPQPAAPQQQTSPPQPAAGNYDFIINPGKPTKRSLFGGGGGSSSSLAVKLLLIVGALFLVFVIIAVVMRSLGVHGSFDKASMLSVAQDQDELIHLATGGTQNSVSTQSKDFAYTVQLSVTSQQTTLNAYFKHNNFKPKPKTIMLKESASVDVTLTNAQASSTYDSALNDALVNALQTYRNDLTAAYNKSDAQGKALLKTDYQGAALLLTQLSSSDS